MSLVVVNYIETTTFGGSCAQCNTDYRGQPYYGERGHRVLAEIEPGLVEPVNLCDGCFERGELDG